MATFTNQATLSYNGISLASNIVSGEVLQVLSAQKTALTGDYAQGDTITYVISLINSGKAPFSGLSVIDNMGEYAPTTTTNAYPLTYVPGSVRLFVNGVLQAAPTVTAGPPTVFSPISVPAGGNALIIYEATVNSFAPPGAAATITNTATVAGTGITGELVATETVTAASEPTLSISKAVSPATVSENGELTYTFMIQNTGNAAADASDNAVITDTFDPVLSNLSVSFNGTPWTEGTNYTYDATTGLFSTVAGQITVPAASYTQDATTGAWSTSPGVSTLIVSGTV